MAEDARSGSGRVRQSGEEGRAHQLRHRRRRFRLDRKSGQGIRVHGEVRHDAHAGDPIRDVGGRRAARSAGKSRIGRGGEICGYYRGGRRSAERYYGAGAGEVCDEGGRGDEVEEAVGSTRCYTLRIGRGVIHSTSIGIRFKELELYSPRSSFKSL